MSKEIDVELREIQKSFSGNIVVDHFNLQIEKGEFISFLGPSGCGKTTTLNMIAGFIEPDSGELLIKGKRMNKVPPYERDLGMVFQTYSLFPHMTVAENVGYGLKLRKVPKAEIKERVARALEVVKLPHVADRYPKQLSGGQRQRIAIARALVIEPSLLLLDEPLSNLDAKLREELRDELKRLHQEIGVTTIFVTHDQEEALALSDRIVIMSHGRIEQIGTPWEVYNEPASEFVHTFIGKTNEWHGTVTGTAGPYITIATEEGVSVQALSSAKTFSKGTPVSMYIRPEKIEISLMEPERNEAGTDSVKGTIELSTFLGSFTEYSVRVGSRTLSIRMQADRTRKALQPGQQVYLTWSPEDCLIAEQGGRANE
ncbi:ABC transporter ATP-binding protein [Aneurinibacillus sp. BA2021]|nr:ABC transporter ATP-binding protein [Aneurinibacillus sp. BA2021]